MASTDRKSDAVAKMPDEQAGNTLDERLSGARIGRPCAVPTANQPLAHSTKEATVAR